MPLAPNKKNGWLRQPPLEKFDKDKYIFELLFNESLLKILENVLYLKLL